MRFLGAERECLERYLPGLDGQLAGLPLAGLESPGSAGIELFRSAGGPALLVPAGHGGLGADGVDAVRVQRALGSRSPSLAVATTMHHFSVAALVEVADVGSGLEWILLRAVAEQRLLMSSGFAEGRTGQNILSPGMEARRVDGGYVVSGAKKPCSLSKSMDLLTVSVAVVEPGSATTRLAVLLVPADGEGVERRPFWSNWVLAGAESDEVVLDDVFVPDQLAFFPNEDATNDAAYTRGFLWFELLISASYLGIASALVERVIVAGRGSAADRVGLGIDLESAMAALERVASTIHDPGPDDDKLARGLFVRYAVERAVERVSMQAAALAGGMAFVGSSDTSYLLAASRALAFHPPGLGSVGATLADHLAGGLLDLGGTLRPPSSAGLDRPVAAPARERVHEGALT
jgi:alkylation response protein AidB-like acyl-CoA dehydrogenase